MKLDAVCKFWCGTLKSPPRGFTLKIGFSSRLISCLVQYISGVKSSQVTWLAYISRGNVSADVSGVNVMQNTRWRVQSRVPQSNFSYLFHLIHTNWPSITVPYRVYPTHPNPTNSFSSSSWFQPVGVFLFPLFLRLRGIEIGIREVDSRHILVDELHHKLISKPFLSL